MERGSRTHSSMHIQHIELFAHNRLRATFIRFSTWQQPKVIAAPRFCAPPEIRSPSPHPHPNPPSPTPHHQPYTQPSPLKTQEWRILCSTLPSSSSSSAASVSVLDHWRGQMAAVHDPPVPLSVLLPSTAMRCVQKHLSATPTPLTTHTHTSTHTAPPLSFSSALRYLYSHSSVSHGAAEGHTPGCQRLCCQAFSPAQIPMPDGCVSPAASPGKWGKCLSKDLRALPSSTIQISLSLSLFFKSEKFVIHSEYQAKFNKLHFFLKKERKAVGFLRKLKVWNVIDLQGKLFIWFVCKWLSVIEVVVKEEG